MSAVKKEQRSRTATRILCLLICVGLALAVALLIPGPLRRWIHESFMERVTSAHYVVLFPAGAISPDVMRQFAVQRESLFNALNQKLDDAASNNELKLVFDFPSPISVRAGEVPSYAIYGTTIQTTLDTSSGAPMPHLDPVADATALLRVAWGKPGSPQIAHWTAMWLVGQWGGQELGMAAAMVEQRIGFTNVASLLAQQPAEPMTRQDRALLAAAWLNQVAEFAGPAQVRKLYSEKVPALDMAKAAATLGTSRPELERRWQLWLYAYVAGMPAGAHQMTLPTPTPK